MITRLERFVFELFAIALLSACTVNAINCPGGKKSEDPVVKEYCKGTRNGHVFWTSSKGTLSAAMLEVDGGKSIRALTNKLARIGERARLKRREDFLLSQCGNPRNSKFSMQQYLTDDQKQWTISSYQYFVPLDMPERKSFCFSSVRMNKSESREVISLIRAFKKVQNDSLPRLKTKLPRVAKWPNLTSVQEYPEEGNDNNVFKCTGWSAAAGRVANNGRDWATISRLTNAPAQEMLPSGKRQFVSELIDANGRSVVMRMFRVNQTAPSVGKTLYYWWGHVASSTHFVGVNTPAMQGAAEATTLHRQVVADTIAASNLAILSLPLFMALVPISCIESVTTPVIFAYALFTDVLTVLPLAVKGIELLVIARATHSVCEAWVTGVESQSSSAAIELWCAECIGEDNFVVIGAVLLSVALFFLVLGITFEVIARRHLLTYLKKNDGSRPSWWSLPILARVGRRRRCVVDNQSPLTLCEECLCSHHAPNEPEPIA